MKDEHNKPSEEKLKSKKEEEQANTGREHIDPLKKETIEEKARRENWTDVAESHLGIDE
jgi:hypothetical protein